MASNNHWLLPDGDHIDFRVYRRNGFTFVSDDGALLDYLFLTGFDLKNKHIDTLLNRDNISIQDGELVVRLEPGESIESAMKRLMQVAVQVCQYRETREMNLSRAK